MEQEVAAYLAVHPSPKPIVGLIAGGAAPANRTLGHAGAIWELESETAESKRALWREVGIHVVATPGDIGPVMRVRPSSSRQRVQLLKVFPMQSLL